MGTVAAAATRNGAEPLFDPQCFVRTANHHRLTTHPHWNAIHSHATGAFTGGAGTAALLSELAAQVRPLGITRHILPGCLADPVDADWLAMQEAVINEAPGHFSGEPLLATVALYQASMS